VASQWLETYWAGTYPSVDEDAIPRRSALNCFSDQMAVIDGLRRIPLVRSRQHGTFGLRDLEIATGQLPPGDADAKPDGAQIDAAFAEMPLDELKGLQRSVADALAALKSIGSAMSSAAGSDAAPEFDPLSAVLTRIGRVLAAQMALRPDGSGADASASDPSGTGAAAVGAIRSRQDAIRALDAVAEFFRRNEPSSPIPLFVERAKRLVSKNFLEVLADVAPDAVPQARTAGGLQAE
jgi:type VI secretion system protein ImpA